MVCAAQVMPVEQRSDGVVPGVAPEHPAVSRAGTAAVVEGDRTREVFEAGAG
ncbi:hypothetical protein [Gemmata massiliana]|uniref:hypothetical protein n=1 Tax=Gemmata massiliana TaxID=1210884 RepID=UPI0013A6EF31|nr:hypothetical protein [Gemmata massiliana]